MRSILSSSVVLSMLAVVSACSFESFEEGEGEPLAESQEAAIEPSAIWNTLTTAQKAIEAFYSGRDWFNCKVVGNCPESEVHREATRVINELGAALEQNERNTLMARALFLIDEAERKYRQPDQAPVLTPDSEDALVSLAAAVHFEFFTKLNGTIETNAAQVDSAYRLSRMFNVVAAMVDNIGQIALQRGRVPISHQWINDKRSQTFQVNEALVGSQNLWYRCSGSTTHREFTDVESFTNAFPMRKLWKKFADYRFAHNSYGNNCNVYCKTPGGLASSSCNAQRSQNKPNAQICAHDCSSDPFGACRAGVLPADTDVYFREVSKILGKMNRDPVVGDARRVMEILVNRATDRGSSMLWLTSNGRLNTWDNWSSTSYSQVLVGLPPPGWEPAATGDFDGDGDGDILMRNGPNQINLWSMDNKRLDSVTNPTSNVTTGFRPISGDLDGDRISDLIWIGTTTFQTPGGPITINISDTWLMNANSTTPRSVSQVTSQLESVQGIGNFDNDSQRRGDVVYRELNGRVNLAMNGSTRFSLPIQPNQWVIKGLGDFNRDGVSDILWYHTVDGTVAVWITRDGALLEEGRPGVAHPSGGWTIQGVADVDHDGFSDIVWRHASGTVSNWMIGGPNTVREFTFGHVVDPSTRFTGMIDFGPPNPANLPLGLGQASCGASSAALRNPGFAEFENWWGGTFDAGLGTLLGDVTGDNKDDMVAVTNANIHVIRSNGSAFGGAELWRSEAGIPGSFPTLLGDVTGDGRADVVTRGNGFIRVRRSLGSSFGNPETWLSGTFHGSRANFAADVDGDRKDDLVAVGDDFVGVLRSTGSGLRLYETWIANKVPFGTRATLMGDVNGDGRADLVAVNDSNVKLWTSNGTAFTGGGVWHSAGFWGSRGTLLGDVDGNGYPDLVALEDGYVRVIRSNGSTLGTAEGGGVSDYETWFSRGFFGSRGTFIGDIDGNKRLDLVASGDGFVGVIRSQ